jgi:hypothetical protein
MQSEYHWRKKHLALLNAVVGDHVSVFIARNDVFDLVSAILLHPKKIFSSDKKVLFV